MPVVTRRTHPSPPRKDRDHVLDEPAVKVASGVLVARARPTRPLGVPHHNSKDSECRLSSFHQSPRPAGPELFPLAFDRGTFRDPGTESLSFQ